MSVRLLLISFLSRKAPRTELLVPGLAGELGLTVTLPPVAGLERPGLTVTARRKKPTEGPRSAGPDTTQPRPAPMGRCWGSGKVIGGWTPSISKDSAATVTAGASADLH